MATEQSIKDKGWSRVKQLFRSLKFLDWLVVAGFVFSVLAMVLTVYFTSMGLVAEKNPLMATLLGTGKIYSILLFGTFWSIVLTAYYTFREKIMGTFLAFHIFSIYLFDIVRDITFVTVVMLK